MSSWICEVGCRWELSEMGWEKIHASHKPWRAVQAVPTTLVGGFHTCLCSECNNAWRLYIDDHGDFVALNAAERERERCARAAYGRGYGPEAEDKEEELFKAEKAANKKLYKVGKAWFEARRAEVEKKNNEQEKEDEKGEKAS